MRDILNEIRNDNTSGATELTLRAADALRQCIRSKAYGRVTELLEEVLKLSKELYLSKPAMAPIINLSAYTLAGVEMAATVGEGVENALNNIQVFITLMEDNTALVAEHAASRIEDGSSFMTISNSVAVARTAMRARGQGKSFRVYCLESRPMMEGAALARKLASGGIDVVLLTDASAFMFVEDVSMVMVGADSLSPQGLINKTGTSGLIMAAEKHGIPSYALCSSEKLLPWGLGYEPKRERYSPSEILENPPDRLEVINCYFDCTPIAELAGVVTEKGLIQSDSIMEHLSLLPTKRHTMEIIEL